MIRDLLSDWKHFRRDSRRKKSKYCQFGYIRIEDSLITCCFLALHRINKFISATTIFLTNKLYATFTEILAKVSTNIGGHQT